MCGQITSTDRRTRNIATGGQVICSLTRFSYSPVTVHSYTVAMMRPLVLEMQAST